MTSVHLHLTFMNLTWFYGGSTACSEYLCSSFYGCDNDLSRNHWQQCWFVLAATLALSQWLERAGHRYVSATPGVPRQQCSLGAEVSVLSASVPSMASAPSCRPSSAPDPPHEAFVWGPLLPVDRPLPGLSYATVSNHNFRLLVQLPQL